jgi:CheY-like chemotaxis protein
MLVEDDENDITLIRRAFAQANVLNPLMVLKNAEEANAYFLGLGPYKNRSEFPLPSLVLLDLKLPGMSGLEFLKWLREQPEFGRTRVVVLTASNLTKDVNTAYQLGANSFLVKPVDFEKFVEISAALKGYWLWLDQAPDTERPTHSKKMPPAST